MALVTETLLAVEAGLGWLQQRALTVPRKFANTKPLRTLWKFQLEWQRQLMSFKLQAKDSN
jgi:hypothetical protein